MVGLLIGDTGGYFYPAQSRPAGRCRAQPEPCSDVGEFSSAFRWAVSWSSASSSRGVVIGGCLMIVCCWCFRCRPGLVATQRWPLRAGRGRLRRAGWTWRWTSRRWIIERLLGKACSVIHAAWHAGYQLPGRCVERRTTRTDAVLALPSILTASPAEPAILRVGFTGPSKGRARQKNGFCRRGPCSSPGAC